MTPRLRIAVLEVHVLSHQSLLPLLDMSHQRYNHLWRTIIDCNPWLRTQMSIDPEWVAQVVSFSPESQTVLAKVRVLYTAVPFTVTWPHLQWHLLPADPLVCHTCGHCVSPDWHIPETASSTGWCVPHLPLSWGKAAAVKLPSSDKLSRERFRRWAEWFPRESHLEADMWLCLPVLKD